MEVELSVFKSLKDVKVVFDVGARTDMLYDGPGVEVHRFEPNPEFASSLSGIVNRFGLSDKEEELSYNTVTQSFVNGKEYPRRIYGWGPSFPLKTLDQYAKDIPRIDFLKIDAEGMDYKILLGGKETLKKTRYIQFEYWDGVQKFIDLLPDFELSLILDSRLYNDVIKPRVTDEKYEKPLVSLTEDVVHLIDKVCIPLGAGGNIFGIRK
jgi:FkbM family methyltransferase